jgi:TorA maturation chaperone TorD
LLDANWKMLTFVEAYSFFLGRSRGSSNLWSSLYHDSGRKRIGKPQIQASDLHAQGQ